MELSKEQAEQLQALADKYPNGEISVLVIENIQNGSIELLDVTADDPEEDKAYFATQKYFEHVKNGTLKAIVHSHPAKGKLEFSEKDYAQMQFSSEGWYLFLAGNQEREYLYFQGVDYESETIQPFSTQICPVLRRKY
ncbi:Mov34/MPN/PAD-1 family protein [Psittacicella hinzii]|uniref:Mov34/MPN/PAD-1 family protein n=1 Tax=Psittacicella hinzii TaxID=2028575 RepID=UPI001CA696CC|nr:Mov34/MPN/PAD-1 family protein [Psittacicella hinzii]